MMSHKSPQIVADSYHLKEFQPFLSSWLGNLSLGRAQIAIDQIRSILKIGDRLEGEEFEGSKTGEEANPPDRVILIAAKDSSNSQQGFPPPPVAAVMAIRIGGDTATVVHAGPIEPDAFSKHSLEFRQSVRESLRDRLDSELQRFGIRFAQWATDVSDRNTVQKDEQRCESDQSWCKSLGFDAIARLDYMSGALANDQVAQSESGPVSLRLQAVSDENQTGDDFESLVERTYNGTLDCPGLSGYRSVNQTLRGYQSSAAVDDRLWFTVLENGAVQPIGCLILAIHRGQGQGDNVIEVVYMALVPEARGRRLGRELLVHAIDQAGREGCCQMILAVDQNNLPARTLYELAGMKPMLHEQVWVKSISVDL